MKNLNLKTMFIAASIAVLGLMGLGSFDYAVAGHEEADKYLKSGWPVEVNFELGQSTLLIGDVNNDKKQEIVAFINNYSNYFTKGDYDPNIIGKIAIFDSEGKMLNELRIPRGVRSTYDSNASAYDTRFGTTVKDNCQMLYDLDGDGAEEIIFTKRHSSSGLTLCVMDYNGSIIWEGDIEGGPRKTFETTGVFLRIEDVNNDKSPEVIVGLYEKTSNKYIIHNYIYDNKGNLLSDVSLSQPEDIILYNDYKMALADINNDATKEIIVPFGGQQLRAFTIDGTILPSFTIQFNNSRINGITAKDINNDGKHELFVSLWDSKNYLYYSIVLESDGSQFLTSREKWPTGIDINQDGNLETVGLSDDETKIVMFDSNGKELKNWQINLPNGVICVELRVVPVGKNAKVIVFRDRSTSKKYVYKANGEQLMTLEYDDIYDSDMIVQACTPSKIFIQDLNNDGKNELVTQFYDKNKKRGHIYVYDFPDIEVTQPSKIRGMITLDGYGGINKAGEITLSKEGAPYWLGYDIAKTIEVVNVGAKVNGYYLLDGLGAVHAVGDVPKFSGGPYFGWDIARDMALVTKGGQVTGYYVLDGFGAVHTVGDAPRFPNGPYFGWDIAMKIRVVASGDQVRGYYILDGYGAVHAVGDVPRFPNGPYFGYDIAKDLELVYDNAGNVKGYYVLDGYGGVHNVGNVPSSRELNQGVNLPYWPLENIAKDIEVITDGGNVAGIYLLDGYGKVHRIGNLPDFQPAYFPMDIAREIKAIKG